MTHAKTIFTRFEDDLRDGGSGVDPSSGGRVAVGIESVFVLLSAPVLVQLIVDRQSPDGPWTYGFAVTLGPSLVPRQLSSP
jgi:hypothetical protein